MLKVEQIDLLLLHQQVGNYRKAWIALVPYINKDGDVEEVCIGTGKKNDLQYYYDRPRIAGDYHGQAPMLWCTYALLCK